MLPSSCLVLKALASLTFLSRFSSCLLVLLSSSVLPHQRRSERNGHLHFGLLARYYHDVGLFRVSLHLILIFRKCLPVKRTLGITHYRGGGVAGQITAKFGRGIWALLRFLYLGWAICSPYVKLAGALLYIYHYLMVDIFLLFINILCWVKRKSPISLCRIQVS